MESFDETKIGQDFEKILTESSAEELKIWLFKENIRVETEKSELKLQKKKFLAEKQQFQAETEETKRMIDFERKRLKQDELFFDKKMDILKNGFAQLDAEKKRLERDKMRFEAERDMHESYKQQDKNMDLAGLLFQGVKSQLTLKKRYRDLLKMFHPDNIAGDHKMVQIINSMYEELKKEYETGKQA